MIKSNEPIEIRTVANGFIVWPVLEMNSGNCAKDQDRKVFRSMAELTTFIEDHFDFRTTEHIEKDPS